MNDDALAIVIGRSGSKGLPGKNHLLLAGRPMVVHSIHHALAARTVGRVVVSTDGAMIAEAARSVADPRVSVIDRPAALATDNSTVSEVLRHARRQAGGDEAIIVVLYANVPVRPDDLIDRAVVTLLATGADSVQSYAPVGKHHPAWMVTIGPNGSVKPNVSQAPDRRQDLPPLHLPDGGVIALTSAAVTAPGQKHPHDFLGTDRRGIVTAPGTVIDVDEPVDMATAEATLRARMEAVT